MAEPHVTPERPAPALYQSEQFEPPLAAPCELVPRLDVAIVGAGITGLAAACHLEGGSRCAVFEAQSIGIGASGRAFGQVVPYLKHGAAKLASIYGPKAASSVIAAASRGPDVVFGLIEKHQIRCGAVRTGLLMGARDEAGLEKLSRTTEDAAASGAQVRILSAAEAEAAIGSTLYPGALLDARGGHVNPLAFTRGLARVAMAQGIRINENTAVESLSRENGRWRLSTAKGGVEADAVIIAGNAYARGLWPGLSESIVPVRVHGTATGPLDARVLDRILPGNQPLTDTRRLYSGVRKIAGRLHLTMDGPLFGTAMGTLDRARSRLAELYPWLDPPPFEEQWSGLIALTRDLVPHVHELAPGLWAGLGYSGRGIAAATLVGRDLARVASGGARSGLSIPLTPLTPLPSARLARTAVAATVTAYRVLDRFDAAKAKRRQT